MNIVILNTLGVQQNKHVWGLLYLFNILYSFFNNTNRILAQKIHANVYDMYTDILLMLNLFTVLHFIDLFVNCYHYVFVY